MKEKIGEIIKEEVRRIGMTQESFAAAMNTSLRNIANLFNKEHLPHDQLIKASKVLKKDFVKEYLDYLYDANPEVNQLRNVEEPRHDYPKSATSLHEISLQVNIFGRIERIQTEFPSLLLTLKREAEHRGLRLG